MATSRIIRITDRNDRKFNVGVYEDGKSWGPLIWTDAQLRSYLANMSFFDYKFEYAGNRQEIKEIMEAHDIEVVHPVAGRPTGV